jgi:alpha-1,2-mannosyltransferase
MFPVYPLLCFNAAVTLYLVRGWLEVAFVAATKSPYRVSGCILSFSWQTLIIIFSEKASQSSIFRNFTSLVVISTSILSLSRILALRNYYHAPLSIAYAFETSELPRLLNETGLLPVPSTHTEDVILDLSSIRELDLRLCLSKEWYRFPGHYLVPDGVRVDFVKSEFAGLLPGHFGANGDGAARSVWWPRDGTGQIPEGLNNRNQEDLRHYVRCALLFTCFIRL